MRERTVEKALVRKGKQRGIKFYKFKTPSRKDAPDRIAFLDGGWTIFVECKRPGEVPRFTQAKFIQTLRKAGHIVYVLDDTSKVDELLDEIIQIPKNGY